MGIYIFFSPKKAFDILSCMSIPASSARACNKINNAIDIFNIMYVFLSIMIASCLEFRFNEKSPLKNFII